MKDGTLDLLAKFFFDCGKVSFAVLVIGLMAQKIGQFPYYVPGITTTLTLCLAGVILNQFKSERED